MRQRESLAVYAPRAVRDQLRWIDNLLARFCKLSWHEPSSQFTRVLEDVDLRIVDLGASAAYVFRDGATNKQALIAPAVREFTDELHAAMEQADAIFFDGTFWSDNELQPFRADARTSRAMGHLPVQESLALLPNAPAPHKIYVHINNTNPILQPESPEQQAVERAGLAVGCDGLEVKL